AFQCGYNLGLTNSSLTRDQISKYCNNQILGTENIRDLTTFGFNTIFIVIGIIIIGIGGDILHNRIIQKKGEIHESHNRVYNDNLWTEIETLQWVLAQILTLRRRSSATRVNSTLWAPLSRYSSYA
ncbi:MAG TPA: hypothetical protein VFY64_11460, partial [Nitrososphaeraceae archaeon]|nr:hypothetical protein [Nitrososphaeraceae archaeon]